jgi:hypothetical protein
VVTLAIAVPDEVPVLSATGEPDVTAHVGRSLAPPGELVSAQLNATDPA